MSDKRKIFVLGTAAYLKKSLISLILEKDVFAQRSSDVKIEKYENDTYEMTCTLNSDTESEEIKQLFSSEQHPDRCLLVVDNRFTIKDVSQKIEEMHKITKKPKKNFVVVLPLGYKNRKRPIQAYPFKSCTMDDLPSKLEKMANKTNRRSDQPPAQMETDDPQSSSATCFQPKLNYGKHKKKFFTEPMNKLKGNHPDNKVNLVLLGMSGTGKSASGNTILGKTKFESKPSSMPITTECQSAETEINGTHVRVIDTPDMFDDEIISSDKNQHVTQCRQLCQSDPCVYLLVMHVSRFTDGERDILRKVEEAFGPKAKEQTIILFTRGEDLQCAGMSFEGFLQDCQPELKNIVKQCGGRCVVFENKNSRQHSQVTKLMQKVNMMLNKQQKH